MTSQQPDPASGKSYRPSNLDHQTELALREEIRTTQSSQADLLKWKLIAVAAVGAVSLGLPGVAGEATGSNELPEEIRTATVEHREAWFRDRGMSAPTVAEQAQWCLFDPILSVIYGAWHLETGDPTWRQLQFHHLNRSLGQLVGVTPDGRQLRCPELFFRDRGTWVPNDVVPLLWTQANLSLALHRARLGDA